MTNPAIALNELIETARDGLEFYTEAVTRVTNPHLKAVFRALIDVKTHLISDLSEHARARGLTPSTGGTFAGSFRKLYGEIRAKLSNQKDATFVAELEDSEDRLLHAFEEAATEASDPEVHRIVAQYLPKVRLCHEQMRNLKMSLAA